MRGAKAVVIMGVLRNALWILVGGRPPRSGAPSRPSRRRSLQLAARDQPDRRYRARPDRRCWDQASGAGSRRSRPARDQRMRRRPDRHLDRHAENAPLRGWRAGIGSRRRCAATARRSAHPRNGARLGRSRRCAAGQSWMRAMQASRIEMVVILDPNAVRPRAARELRRGLDLGVEPRGRTEREVSASSGAQPLSCQPPGADCGAQATRQTISSGR